MLIYRGANLSGTNLTNVKLYKTNFSGANLSNSNLTDAKIEQTTNFTKSNMTNVIVNENKLKLAIINGAIIKPKIKVIDRLLFFNENSQNNIKKITPTNI